MRRNIIRKGTIGIGLLRKSTATIDDNDIAESSFGVSVDQGSRAAITRNRIHECLIGVFIENDSSAAIESNTITANRGNGIQVDSGAQVIITGNILGENGDYGIAGSAEALVTLGENTFRGNKSGDSKIEAPKPKSPN